MDHREIQELIDRIAIFEAKQAELNDLQAEIAAQSADVFKEIVGEIERLRELQQEG